MMGPDEQPSVQKWTITDCHHPREIVHTSVVILRFIFKLNLNTFSMYNKSV